LYHVIQKSTGAVGGYGHNGPVYGEITMGTFQKVVDALALHTDFDASSSFVDIGSGLGKPNLHVALNPGVKLSFGIELEKLRWELSMHNLRFVLEQVPEMRKSVVYFANKDATEMENFEPFTHVYMFDVGFPPSVLVSLANAFNLSKTVRALVSFQRPDKVISVYGFAVDLITQIQTRMSGSTELHTAYIYSAKQDHGIKARPQRQLQLDTNFLVSKAGKKVPTKVQPNKKGFNVLAELQSEEYNSWVETTGVIGAPGERPQRGPLVKYGK
jgi:SAM-dependent methyltransferase